MTVIYNDLHKKKIKMSSILKLQTPEGLLEGHAACANYLEVVVGELLLQPAQLSHDAQETLLSEIEPVFSDKDNDMLATPPTKQDVWDTLADSNLNAAPGTDGINSFVYKSCWDTLGDPLFEVVSAVFQGEPLSPSQRTSMMVFGCKP